MSSIVFHSSTRQVSVRFERQRFHRLCWQMLLAVFDLGRDLPGHPHPIRKIFPVEHQLHSAGHNDFRSQAELAISTHEHQRLRFGDAEGSFFTAALNTALIGGSDQIKLAAKLHGLCELHAFVEGANRNWLAQIIEDGVGYNIFTSESWAVVIEMLRESSEEPIVTSFSGSNDFPNRHLSLHHNTWNPENEDESAEEWLLLSEEERWKFSVDALRKESKKYHNDLELTPNSLGGFFFDEGVSAFDIMRVIEMSK